MRLLIALFAVVAIAGCSFLQTDGNLNHKLAFQYSTAKIIERDRVSALDVIDAVERAEGYVRDGAEVTVSKLAQGARDYMQDTGLSPADRILIGAILDDAEARLTVAVGDGLLTKDERLQLYEVLQWIKEAAQQ